MGIIMSALRINKATIEDLEMLAVMNKQLIEDERHDNPMGIEALKERMREFILGEYEAYIFKDEEVIRGYALVNQVRKPVYLRQLYICRDSRRSGIGKACFQLLLTELRVRQLDVEVMYWNEAGYKFWKSLGFEERSVYLRLKS